MKVCFVTGKRLMFGNNVSYSNNKTRRTFCANIQNVKFFSKVLGVISIKATPKGVKTVEFKGGIDAFLDAGKVFGIDGKRLLKHYLNKKSKG